MEMFFIFLIICVLLFVCVWGLFLLYARHLSKASGWDIMAQCYRAQDKPEGQVLKNQSLMVGNSVFNKMISFGATEEGLYLKSWFTRRALLIPWYEIGRSKETLFQGGKAYTITIGDPQVGVLTLPMQLFVLVQSFTERKRYY